MDLLTTEAKDVARLMPSLVTMETAGVAWPVAVQFWVSYSGTCCITPVLYICSHNKNVYSFFFKSFCVIFKDKLSFVCMAYIGSFKDWFNEEHYIDALINSNCRIDTYSYDLFIPAGVWLDSFKAFLNDWQLLKRFSQYIYFLHPQISHFQIVVSLPNVAIS